MLMPPSRWTIEVDAFDPEVLSELIAGSHFKQRLLRGGAFHARLERLSLGVCRLDWGQYSLPCYGEGAIPEGWLTIGLSDGIVEPPWLNGLLLQGSDIQVCAEGAPVDCRCAPNTAWYALQVRRNDLQAASLAVNGRELALPTSGLQNLHLPRCQAVFFRAVLQEGLQMGFALNGSTDGRVTSRIAQRLISAAARALFAATGCCDGRTERAVRRRLQVLRAAEDFVQRRLGDAVTMQDMAAAAATSERSLEYLFGDAYGVSPHTWLLLARLHRVRHELLTSDGFVSVRRAALKWGLPHGGRFAARYRELFGEFPRETAARRS